MAAIPQSLPAANDPADQDPIETREWLDALETVIEREGPERAHFLLEQMLDVARRSGANIPFCQHHRLRQYHPDAARGAFARQCGIRGAHPQLRPLECHGDGSAGQQAQPARTAATSVDTSLRSHRSPR